MIECRGISARVGNFDVSDVSLLVPDGGHAVVTGPTASGKSTLLHIIAGGIRPLAGIVRIRGEDVTRQPPECRRTALVAQHGYLFPHLDVRRNVEYRARDAETAQALCRKFGIQHLLHRRVSMLSGGERQLVALCRALAPRPEAVLLDEPFSALDADRRRVVAGTFRELQADWKFSVLHITHDPADYEPGTLHFRMADGALTAASEQRG